MEPGSDTSDAALDRRPARAGQITRRQFVLTTAVAVICVLVLWDTPVLLPLQWTVTFVHEAMHALVAMFVGADVGSVTINSAGGGLTTFRGNTGTLGRVAIGSAGYVGAAVAGGAMFELSSRVRSGRVAVGGLAFGIVAVGLAWVPLRTTPDALSAAVTGSSTGDGRFTIGFCIVAVLVLAGLIAQPSIAARRLFLVVVAAGLCLGAVEDLRDVFGSSRRGGGSDASILHEVTGVPAWLWATAWMLLGIAACGLGIWSALSSGRKRRGIDAGLLDSDSGGAQSHMAD